MCRQMCLIREVRSKRRIQRSGIEQIASALVNIRYSGNVYCCKIVVSTGVGTGVQSDTQTHIAVSTGVGTGCAERHTDTHKYVGLIVQCYRTKYQDCLKLMVFVIQLCNILYFLIYIVIKNLIYIKTVTAALFQFPKFKKRNIFSLGI